MFVQRDVYASPPLTVASASLARSGHRSVLSTTSGGNQNEQGRSVVTRPGTSLDRARRGDVAAFESLVREHDDHMRAVAFRMLGRQDAMDDALQDAYLRAFRAIDGFRGEAKFSTWLHRIVTTTCIDHLRRRDRRREVALPDDDDRGWAPSTADPAAAATRRTDVGRALDALPADQRVTLLLVDGEGYPYDDVAEMLGVAPGTISSRITRARATMRTLLEAR